ncbi:DUF397 domain-containing protein [Amycolatopsis sp. H20-H5]|uniref:DUF397 domain-containing protein n=1 Tax=Amycolatopsis sp. H20-H5 TaxID=3046309 RepID=UPI002DBFCDBC|nr:DUF397 domain-containing protein [Amycolatopsis sp. H20-H5]MEC3976559.1 DUF397 domain-containing protein [Amycolatopsis sp. H20-H5]
MTSTRHPHEWFKSSYSNGGNNNCVEARVEPGTMHVRDSKAPHSGDVSFARQPWEAFLASLR